MTAGFFWNRKKDGSVEKIISDDRKTLTGCRAGSQGKRTRHRGSKRCFATSNVAFGAAILNFVSNDSSQAQAAFGSFICRMVEFSNVLEKTSLPNADCPRTIRIVASLRTINPSQTPARWTQPVRTVSSSQVARTIGIVFAASEWRRANSEKQRVVPIEEPPFNLQGVYRSMTFLWSHLPLQ